MRFSPISIFLGIIPTLAIYIMGGCTGLNEERNRHVWHRYYEPAESRSSINFSQDSFKEATRLYGESFIPVEEIHIRQSVRRKHSARLARADILNWREFIEILSDKRDKFPVSHVWGKLSPKMQATILSIPTENGRELSVFEQLRLTRELNLLIDSESFYDPKIFSSTRAYPSPGWLTFFSHPKRERFNRELLDIIFPSVLTPFHKIIRVPEGIKLCEIVDQSAGRFTLYVSVPQNAPEFKLQLAHEALHLLNPYLFDWYMEGLCSVFSAHMAKLQGHSFEPWRQHFEARRNKDPYAISYFMMQEITAVAGDSMHTFLDYAVWSDSNRRKMHLDIDAWLAIMPKQNRQNVIKIIATYGPKLKKKEGRQATFHLPASLGKNH